jgi:hypothetical protein
VCTWSRSAIKDRAEATRPLPSSKSEPSRVRGRNSKRPRRETGAKWGAEAMTAPKPSAGTAVIAGTGVAAAGIHDCNTGTARAGPDESGTPGLTGTSAMACGLRRGFLSGRGLHPHDPCVEVSARRREPSFRINTPSPRARPAPEPDAHRHAYGLSAQRRSNLLENRITLAPHLSAEDGCNLQMIRNRDRPPYGQWEAKRGGSASSAV